jgi:erythritol kinase
VLNSPLHTTEASQVAARGAVIGARLAAKLPTGPEWIAETRQIDPDPSRAAFYDEGYAHYLRRSEAARPRWADPAPTARSSGA